MVADSCGNGEGEVYCALLRGRMMLLRQPAVPNLEVLCLRMYGSGERLSTCYLVQSQARLARETIEDYALFPARDAS